MEHALDTSNCIACGEGWGEEGECEGSQRGCGHHCNHLDTHDACCWCSAVVDGEGQVVIP